MDENGNTRLQKMKSWCEDHPIFSVLMFLGTSMAGLSTLVTSGIVILGTLGILNVNARQPKGIQPARAETPAPEVIAADSPASGSAAGRIVAVDSAMPSTRPEPVQVAVAKATVATPSSVAASPAEATEPVHPAEPVRTPEPVQIRRADVVRHSPTPAPVPLKPFFENQAVQPQPSVAAVAATPAPVEAAASVAPSATPERDELVPVRRAERASATSAD